MLTRRMLILRSLCLAVALLTLALPESGYAASGPFDSHRDAEQDLLLAEKQAAAEHKNIFLDFGGNWCSPCVALDQYLHEDPRLMARLERGYVVVHVSIGIWSSSKQTTVVRNRYPKFKEVPHLLILASDGTLLHDASKDPIAADPKRNIYDYDAVAALLDKWAPAPQR
jgi:thioredoxin-related protein